jgi:hypothetical protein
MASQPRFGRLFSFEFFPPKSEEAARTLQTTVERLSRLKPRFCSVTCGAGGSTREKTFETVVDIQRRTGIECAPHLSCVASTRQNIREVLEAYRAQGIRHIVALRGDLPSGMLSAGEFRYASELVEFKAGTILTSRSPPTPSVILRRRASKRTSGISSARWMRARIAPSPSTSTIRRPIFGSWMIARKPRSIFLSCRASCRSQTTPSWRGSRNSVVPIYPAGCANAWRVLAMIARRSAHSASRSSPTCADAFSIRAHPAYISIH